MKNRTAIRPKIERTDWLDRIGWAFLTLGLATVPLVYFFNQIITEYYWVKAVWSTLLLPVPMLIVMFRWWKDGRVEFPKAHTLWPYIVFLLIILSSIIGAANPWKAWERVLQAMGGFWAYLAVIVYVRNRDDLRTFIYLALVAAFGVTFYGMTQYTEIFYLPKDQYGTADPSTTIGLTNFVVEYLTVMMQLVAVYLIVERRNTVRALAMIGVAVVYFYFAVAQNRAGYVGLAFGWVVVYVLLMVDAFKRKRAGIAPKGLVIVVSIAIAATAVTLVATPIGAKIVERITSIDDTESDASIKFRIETWKQALIMWPEHPIRGFGLSNFEVEVPKYYTPFLEGMTLRHNTRIVRAHNEYVQIIVDLGLLGVAGFLWFLFAIGRNAVGAYRSSKTRDDFVIMMAFVGGLAAYFAVAFFAFPMHVPSSSIIFFAFVGLFDRFCMIVEADPDGIAGTPQVPSYVKELGGVGRGVVAFGLAVCLVGLPYVLNICFHGLTGEVRNKEARLYKDFKKWDETRILMNDAIQNNPYNEGYYYDRAVAHLHFNDKKAALRDLMETRELVPNYGMGRKQIGRLALEMRNYDLAITELEHALRIFPSQRAELVNMIGSAAISAGKSQKAIDVLTDAIGKGVTQATTYILLANAYSFQNDHTQAIEYFRKGIALDPKQSDYRINYAATLLEAKQLEQSLSEYEQIVNSVEPKNARAWLGYAKVLYLLKRPADAEQALKRAIGLDPSLREKGMRDPLLANDPKMRRWLE